MSGPKVSIYEMSGWQRHNLRAQLNCMQQGLACCEEINKVVSYLSGIGGQIQTLLSTFDIINQRTKDCSEEICNLTDIQDAIAQDCSACKNELLQSKSFLQAEKIVLSDAELAKKKDILAKLKELRSKVVSQQKGIEESLQALDAKAKQGVIAEESAIAEDIASVQSFFISPTETEDTKFETEKKKLEEQIRVITLSNDCPTNMKGEVLSTVSSLSRITTKERLDTFYAVTIQPLLRKIEVAHKRVREQESEFNGLLVHYTSLCSIAGVQPEILTLEGNGLEALKNRVAALEKQVVIQTEQEYISDCVNEVMAEMGYDIIGFRSVKKRSGKRFRNELFTYGEGTAINVTYDDNGQIAMELGGIDRTDRVPTSNESNVLCKDMESFCSDFMKFEERLKAKGVEIKSRVSMAPPTEEYASIINVSDYNVTATKPVREMAVKEVHSKDIAKQALRMEDN